MEKKKLLIGHLVALFTITIWSTTFVCTKVLLIDFSPSEILMYRLLIALISLKIVSPKKVIVKDKKHEIYFVVAALTGVVLYFLLENIALIYSFASNVATIISVAPFFTVILASFFIKEIKLKSEFILGFIVAIIGIFLISFNGNVVLKLNPLGDILAVLSAFMWAIYSIVVKKISDFNYSPIEITKKVFSYAIVFMIPILFAFKAKIGIERLANPVYLLNLIYLGAFASALCFVTWNYAMNTIGTVKATLYIYLSPVVASVVSLIVLNEKITPLSVIGIGLTLLGLLISENRIKLFKNKKD